MRYKSLIMLGLIANLYGCAALEDQLYSGFAGPRLDAAALDSGMAVLRALQKTEGLDGPLIPAKCFKVPVMEPDVEQCTASRNEAVAVIAMVSSNLCTKHRQTIYGRDATANITFGTLTNLFAGAAAVAGSEGAKTLYAALALFSNSERSLVNETVYKQMLVTAVDAKILEAVNLQQATIRPLLNMPVNQYTMTMAITDLTTLHQSCSFMNGLRLALAEGASPSRASKLSYAQQQLNGASQEVIIYCHKGNVTDPEIHLCTRAKERYDNISERVKIIQSELL